MISLCTNTPQLNHHTNNAVQGQTHTGKYQFLSGKQFFIELTRANRSEKLQGIMACRMKLSGVLVAQHEEKQANVFILPHIT